LFEEHYGAPSVNALSQAGKAYLESANDGVLSDRGILMVAQSGQEIDLATEAKAFHMAPLSVPEACAIIPILNPEKITAAALSWGAKDIDTDRLIQNFARDCRAKGGEIRTSARVSAIAKTHHGWDVRIGPETISAKILINAAGSWVDEIASLAGISRIGFQPYRRSMARTPAPNGLNITKWPVLFGVGEAWYAKPDAGQLIISPAEEHPMVPCDAYADDLVLAEGIARYSEVVTSEVTRITSNWAGLRTFAPDRTLVIGFDPDDSTFFWLGGQGGYGFQTAPGASQLVADLIGGTTSDLSAKTIAALSPTRFSG
jgi:glycine/D-amino acid oxidase-like deaminating enzyme